MGHSRFEPDHDRITSPSYLQELLIGRPGPEPACTWTTAEAGDQRSRLRYLRRQEELSQVGRIWERFGSGPAVSWVPDDFADNSWFTQLGVRFLAPVRRYQDQPDCRWAAQRAVLDQLPTTGSIILIAHSLGSVVAVDLLTKLPADLHVDLLVTIGSPLAIKHLGHPRFEADFPYDRVGGWVNFYDTGDFVTIGRGVGRRFPAACDIAVQTGQSHDAVAYLSNPGVAAVIGHHAFGVQNGTGPAPIQRRLHPAWQPLLLSFAYSSQLSSCAEGKRWLFKARVDTARSLLAKRTVADVRASRQQLLVEKSPRLDDSPVGEGRFPNEDDLMHHAGDLVRGTWTDEALLSLAVGLEMSQPLHAFDIKVSEKQRHTALLNTLHRVREPQGNVSDPEFAQAAQDGVRAAKKVVKESGFPWATVLISGGLLVLSMTGAGLAVAAPAGLAGAAIISGTLAAFGPGGMIGGLITIATLTGVGAAATGIGVGVGTGDDSEVVEATRRLAVEELARMPIAALRNAVVGVLAVVHAQRRLRFRSTGDLVEDMLSSALEAVRAECVLHEALAPERTGTKEWRKKVDLLEKALEWLRESHLTNDSWHQLPQDLTDLPEMMSRAKPLGASP
jgi:pimeloyl-ACP methyl ester carboxylesterase